MSEQSRVKARLAVAMVALVGWLQRRAGTVMLLAVLLTTVAALRIPHLKIKSDLADLLPDHFPSIRRLREIEKRLGTQADMVVVVQSPSFEQNTAFGARLADGIRGLRGQVGSVLFRRDRAYFEDHALLYVDVPDLEKLRTRVRGRIRKAVARSMSQAVGFGGEDDGEEPPEGEDDEEDEEDEDEFDRRSRKKVEAAPAAGPGAPPAADPGDGTAGSADEGASADSAPLGGDSDNAEIDEIKKRFAEYDLEEYMRTDDGTLVVLKVRPLFPPTQMEKAQALTEQIRLIAADLQPHRFHPELRISFEGDYAEKAVEMRGIRSDIVSSAAVCIGLLMLVIGLHFRSLRAVPMIIVPTVAGIVWTLGFAQVTIGHLNIVSSFIFAILMGLGIDYSIHALSRYDEERRAGRGTTEALILSLQHSGLSNLTAALTTIAVFLMLLLADFRGFSEFGFMAAVGICFSIINVFIVWPAGVVLLERWWPARYALPQPAADQGQQGGTAQGARGRRWRPGPALTVPVLLVSLAAAGFSVWAATQLEFEYSFAKLSEKVRAPAPSAPAKGASAKAPKRSEPRYLEAAGRTHDVAPAVALTQTLEETRLVYETFQAILDIPEADLDHPERWTSPLLASVRQRYADPAGWARYAQNRIYRDMTSLWRFVPQEQDAKLAIMADVRRLLERKVNLFEGKERERMDRLLGYLKAGAVQPDEFPDWVLDQFRDRQGRLGRFLLFRARGAKADYRVSSALKEAFWELRFGDRSYPVAASYFVLPEVVDTIRSDGKLTVSLALLAITVLLFLMFRSPMRVLAVLVPLLVGATSLAGFLYVADIKLNYFNVIVIPLLLGMGVDNGIHLFERLSAEGSDRVLHVLRHTGGAAFLTTLTTCIGFGGLWVANHRGLQSLGTTAIAGMTLCLLAAVATQPALVIFAEWVRHQRSKARR